MGQYKHIARDQYGDVYWLGKYPRKELLMLFGRKHADKMYVDNPSAETQFDSGIHIGYVIAQHRLAVWKIKPLGE